MSMKKNKQGNVIIILLICLVTLLAVYIYKSITQQEKSYEYALNGEIGVSSNCYLKKDITYCEVDNKVIRVDNYYEVK